MLGLTPPAAAATPEPHRLRIVVRLGDDGRLEHGVQLADGERILPTARFLPADAPVGAWRVSGDVEVAGTGDRQDPGPARRRRPFRGRLRRRPTARRFTPHIAYLPADAGVGVWYRSSEIEVPAAAMLDDDG